MFGHLHGDWATFVRSLGKNLGESLYPYLFHFWARVYLYLYLFGFLLVDSSRTVFPLPQVTHPGSSLCSMLE